MAAQRQREGPRSLSPLMVSVVQFLVEIDGSRRGTILSAFCFMFLIFLTAVKPVFAGTTLTAVSREPFHGLWPGHRGALHGQPQTVRCAAHSPPAGLRDEGKAPAASTRGPSCHGHAWGRTPQGGCAGRGPPTVSPSPPPAPRRRRPRPSARRDVRTRQLLRAHCVARPSLHGRGRRLCVLPPRARFQGDAMDAPLSGTRGAWWVPIHV